MPAIQTTGLTRRYGDATVLDGLDLEVRAGTVHGLLGPNGAGKTTTVRILSTLLDPHGGTASVAGFDVVREPAQVRRHVGLVGQHAAVDEILGGRDNLVMFGRLSHLGTRGARRRADELLEQFGLVDAAERPVSTYSGGMRRRLDLAAGLVLDPTVLLLDEPTTGLDPAGRREVWRAVRALVAGGTAVLLTTQYLEEADLLADEIVVIDHGRIIAQGTSDDLKREVGGERLEITVTDGAQLDEAGRLLAPLGLAPPTLDVGRRTLVMPVAGGASRLAETLRVLDGTAVTLDDIGLRRPTLDDVFLSLTGRTTQNGDGDGEQEGQQP